MLRESVSQCSLPIMFLIRSGTPADVEAASAFLSSNGLSSGALQSDPGVPAPLFTTAWRSGCVVGLARGAEAREERGTGAPIPGRFHVNTVIVAPEFRGAGAGRGLVEQLLRDAQGAGFRTAQLWVHTDNVAAVALYGRFGFVQSGPAVDDERVGRIQPMSALLRQDRG